MGPAPRDRPHRSRRRHGHRRVQPRLAPPGEQVVETAESEPRAQEAPPPQAPQQAPQGTDTNTKLAQLRELAELRDSGVVDEAEFELQKSQILNS